MAEHTYEQLRDMTVAQLREIAAGIQDDRLEGYTTMHKDHLLPTLCKIMGIHTHHAAQGEEKTRIKSTIHKLRAKRDAAAEAGDSANAARARRQIHVLKHRLRRMAKAQ